MIEVSVCVLAYNHEKYIRKALDSILAQKTDFEYEILVHDDASTDDTANIIREYAAKYPRVIKPYFQTENQYSKGVTRINYRFNETRASGKYIALCEGDDYWISEDKLQHQYDYLEKHPDKSMHMHAAEIVNNDGVRTGEFLGEVGVNKVVPFGEIIKFYPTASKMYRKEILCNPPDFFFVGSAGDFPSFMLILAYGDAYYEGTVMSAYRKGVPGSSNDIFAKLSKEKKIQHFEDRIAVLNGMDKYTNGKFRKDIGVAISMEECHKAVAMPDFTDKLRIYKKLHTDTCFQYCSFVRRLKIFCAIFLPMYDAIGIIKHRVANSVHRLGTVFNS